MTDAKIPTPAPIKKEKKKATAKQLLSDLLLGGVIAAMYKTAMSPVERVKLLMPTMESHPDVVMMSKREMLSRCNRSTLTRHSDIYNWIRTNYGIKFFFRGNLVNCLRYAPQEGSALAFNDVLNDMFPDYSSKTDFWKSLGVKLFSGGLAGAIANTICFPFDFARTRLASDLKAGEGQFKGIADCIFSTVKSQGLTGLYTGWTVTVLGAFVYRAGQLGCFKQIQELNPYKSDKGVIGAVSAFAAVTVARTVVMPFNYPFDTVRRRMMLQSEKPKSERLYKGSIDCFTKVLQKEGLKGMYKGLVPELFRGVGGSLVIVIYDRVKTMLGGYN